MSCVEVRNYSGLLGSCVRMLLSTCAYIITHSAVSTEAKRTRATSEKETHQQRNGQSVVTRQEEESFSRQRHSKRTAVEREVESDDVPQVREVRDDEEAPDINADNQAAAVCDGAVDDATTTTTWDTEPLAKAKVYTLA